MNVALDDLSVAFTVDVTDKLNGYGSAVFGLERQIFITNVILFLKRVECIFGQFSVLEQPKIPQRLSDDFFRS